MKHNISLRAATQADARMIANIYLASRKEFISFARLRHSDAGVYQWILETLIPTNQVIVAIENESIVGMMGLSKNQEFGLIDQLYLCPAVVGRGIGTLLVAAAKSTLGSPIRLHTFQENIRARQFYERNGFIILKMNDGLTNEEKCPEIIYEWRSSNS
jgi:RimJ/RimL family protein N-acetyltransferase